MWPSSTQTGTLVHISLRGCMAPRTIRCKPKKCRQECKKSCPVVKIGTLPPAAPQNAHCITGKLCVEVAPTSKIAWISEELCIGCGICVKVLQRALMCHLLCTIIITEMPF